MSRILPRARILVTGASGFLGSHVADALSEAGYSVLLFDHTPSHYRRPGQLAVIGDLLNLEDVRRAAQDCAAIYHFAAVSDIEEASKDPIRTAEVNLMGTVNLLDAARRARVSRFVFASSVYAYSKAGGIYRASKQACENFIEAFQEQYGLAFTILRYGSLYGRRASPGNRIHRMINSAITQGRIEECGNGEAIREFVHVRDAAQLSVEVLDDRYENQHFLLTGLEKYRLIDVARMIREIFPGDIEIDFSGETADAHYDFTPYQFNPKVGRKMVPRDFVDFGQGLLDCIDEVYQSVTLKEAV
jgi:UDP-glucose 4-epimerase